MQRIANPCTPVRFRYPPPQYLVIFPKKRHLKQDLVTKFLYTICTQNIGVDLAISAPQSSLKEILSKQ